MSYTAIAQMQRDPDIRDRVSACVAMEVPNVYPEGWVQEKAWLFATQPDWTVAWDNALSTHANEENYRPGHDPLVITDQMILSAVQLIASNQAPS